MRQSLITSFPSPSAVSVQVWSKSTHRTAAKAHFYSPNTVVTLKIGLKSPKSNLSQMIQHMKLSLNPSVGSRDRVHVSVFWHNISNLKCLCDLENEVNIPKSKHFFPLSRCCICASLVKIHHCADKAHFCSLNSVVALANGSRSPESNQIF